jgi:uncharacterized metal-binding protein YceD (DUF177 family)
MNDALPLSVPLDLGSVTEPRVQNVTPSPEVRSRIAAWAGLDSLDSLNADIRVTRVGDAFYTYEGRVSADVTQSCVISLEPVRSHIEREFSRRYQLVRKRRGEPAAEDGVIGEGENEVEVVVDPVIDLAGPLLEELSLAIDPYPRVPGAVFAAPEDEAPAKENPFAVLKQLTAPAGKGGRKTRKS